MKTKVKRIIPMLLALVLLLSIGTTSFAGPVNPGGAPDPGDTATITISGVESGATVKAYQIVKADYDATGFTGYSAVTNVNVADPTKPTNAEVIAFANAPIGTPVVLAEGAGGNYSNDQISPGYWVVIVTGGTKMYNPMLAGVYYSSADSTMVMDPTPLGANTQWNLNNEVLYIKSTTKPNIDKTIVGGGNTGTGAGSGDDFSYGDTVSFQIDTTIPSYSQDFQNVTFIITDTLSNGLDFTGTGNVTVKVDSTEVSAGENTYSLVYDAATRKMTIIFAEAFLYNKPVRSVQVTYSATVNTNAPTNFNANTNKVELEYSNDPSDSASTDKIKDKTYIYTFEINGNVLGAGTTGIQLKKTGEEDENNPGTNKPLQGAQFSLTGQNKTYTATSDANGYISFKGLDAGTYTLKETVAPSGYSLNTKEYPVVIAAEYNADGTLKQYTITIDGTATSTYACNYNPQGEPEIVTNNTVGVDIPNTKVSVLPSTGGIGTVIFTVVGVSLMAAAVAFFVLSKKRNSTSNR